MTRQNKISISHVYITFDFLEKTIKCPGWGRGWAPTRASEELNFGVAALVRSLQVEIMAFYRVCD
jgi:hypothetical protein